MPVKQVTYMCPPTTSPNPSTAPGQTTYKLRPACGNMSRSITYDDMCYSICPGLCLPPVYSAPLLVPMRAVVISTAVSVMMSRMMLMAKYATIRLSSSSRGRLPRNSGLSAKSTEEE